MLALFQITPRQKNFFNDKGYLIVENIITETEVETYKKIYDRLLDGTIDTGKNRSDLGAGLGDNTKTENITQIMWPSDFVPKLLRMPTLLVHLQSQGKY